MLLSKMTLVLTLVLSMPALLEDWAVAKDQDGVMVYTRHVEGTSLKEFKGVIILKTTPDKVLAQIRDAEHHRDWMHNTKDSKIARWNSPDDFYTYAINDAPWPVADRDNVVHMQVSHPDAKTTRVKMTGATGIVPEVEGVVRVKMLNGFWLIEEMPYGLVRVTQQCIADPGGSLPNWLVNSAVVDNPFNTLLGLQKRIGG
jgi:hypothetical protein